MISYIYLIQGIYIKSVQNFLRLHFDYVNPISISSKEEAAKKAQLLLKSGEGSGSEFLGWRDLPLFISPENISQIESVATRIQKADALIVIGIGGSYLGTRAVLSGCVPSFTKQSLPIYFAGQQMDALYHQKILENLKKKRYAIAAISKSGTTLEPALAFRIFWNDLTHRFSKKELQELIFIVTDAEKGALRKLASEYNLTSFDIPNNVGGRYSIFTPVGLLPLAAANISIRNLLKGANEMALHLQTTNFSENPALQYAAYRNAAYCNAGKKIEILAYYQQNLYYISEWWKQLFGESEGKNGIGIYPSTASLTTDLHSIGQWVQEGERTIFETVLDIENVEGITIPHFKENIDNLNYLSGKKLHTINRSATLASLMAHQAGKVPCLRISIPEINEYTIGGLLYFFEYSCAISAYMLGVNPFNQPGVETYKKNMYCLLKDV